MDQRLRNMCDAFEGLRFEECIRISDEILKKLKKDGKKKLVLSNDQNDVLYILRVGSLAATGHIDQANQTIRQKFNKAMVSSEHSFLFLQICTMALDDRLPIFTEEIQKQKDNKKIDINRFTLINRNFSGLAKTFLKKFTLEKKSQDSLKQIYLEYLQQLQNNKLINYQRDKVIPECKDLKLQLVSMFLEKFSKLYADTPKNFKNKLEETVDHKTKKGIQDLKLRISIHEGKSANARQQYKKLMNSPMVYPFPYLRSIKRLSAEQQYNRAFWAKEFLEIFKKNLDLDQYQPIFAYNCEFIDELLKEIKQDIQKVKKPSEIELDLMYSYQVQPLAQLQNYYNSLYTSLIRSREKEEQLKKKDFYYISIKNIILQLIKISEVAKDFSSTQQFLTFLKQYFGKTLTFSQQIQPYLKNKDIFTNQYLEEFMKTKLSWKPEDNLIWQINIEKMFVKETRCTDVTKMFEKWERYTKLYFENKAQIQGNKPLQKGERYLSDQFVVLAADSVQLFVEKENLPEKVVEDCFFYIVAFLQKCIEYSPYNSDLKLRAIYFYDKLNYNQSVIQLCESMDIKAVQFETIGFIYLKAIMNASLYDSQEHLLIKMTRSYQQNYREASEYAYKAILHLSFDECEQNLSYHRNINQSYNFLILLYIFYMKNHGKQSSRFYLQEIIKRITINSKNISFNCDFSVMRNKLFLHDQLVIAEFYGVFNNYKLLENQCKIKLAFHDLQQTNQCKLQGLKCDWEPKQAYQFDQYVFFERKLNYKYTGEILSEKNTAFEIKHYNMITDIRIKIIKLLMGIKKQDIAECKGSCIEISQKINQYNQFLSQLSWRLQSKLVPNSRAYISEIIPYISNQIEHIGANKKKYDKPGERKQLCSTIINQLIEAITDNIKWCERLKVQKQHMTEKLMQNQEFLERLVKMDSKEFKKTYRIK